MKKTTLLLIIFCTFLMPRFGLTAEIYKIFLANRFDLYLDARYFKTVSNFGPGGDKQSLSANSGLQNINLQTTARYAFLSQMAIYSGLSFGNVESNNGTNTRTNSALTDFFLGADYQLFQSQSWSLYSDFSYAHSNEKIDLNGDEALASDGASEFKALVAVIVKSESLAGFAKVGYNYRTEGLSSLFLYGLGGEYLSGHSAIGIELDGLSSVKDDEQTASPAVRETLTNRVNAGSKKYFSINPNSLEAQIYYAYAFDPNFIIKLNGGSTVVGSNSASGYFAGLSLNLGFGGADSRPYKPLKKGTDKLSLPEDEPGFKVETDDGVNQDIFKSVEPVRLKSAEPIKPK